MECSAETETSRWDQLGVDWCPVARALSVIGDRWTMLIVRDCFLGKSRFEEIQKGLGVTRHVLSNRLKRLMADGVLERNAYSQRPVRYEYRLTAKGRDFAPALLGLKDWGKKHMPIRKRAA